MKAQQVISPITWTLVGPVQYSPNTPLELTITLKPSEAGKYYVRGALYDSNSRPISGTIFSLFLFGGVGTTYGVNSASYVTIYDLAADEEAVVPCLFQFPRSSATLGVIMYKMAGAVPAPGYDTEVGQQSVALENPGIDLSPIINTVALPLLTLGLVAMVMKSMMKS